MFFKKSNQPPFDFINIASLEIHLCLCYNKDNESGFQSFNYERKKKMSIEMIGKNISALRKERGFKQEELARAVGVSTQAVSKWENGGVPDVELLPAIADFFGVSVDLLFGRNINDYCDLSTALMKNIAEAPEEDKMKKVLDYCWDMERALFPRNDESKFKKIEDCQKKIGDSKQGYSTMMNSQGFTRMGLGNRLEYFLIASEPENLEKAYLDGVDYPAFFKDFSDKDVFNAYVMLDKRNSNKGFTANLLVNNLGLTAEKANEVINILMKYNVIYVQNLEMDDEVVSAYKYSTTPSPSFAAMLIFAREMIEQTNNFYYYCGNRKKPYLS